MLNGPSVSRVLWKVPYPIYIIFRLLLDIYDPDCANIGTHNLCPLPSKIPMNVIDSLWYVWLQISSESSYLLPLKYQNISCMFLNLVSSALKLDVAVHERITFKNILVDQTIFTVEACSHVQIKLIAFVNKKHLDPKIGLGRLLSWG